MGAGNALGGIEVGLEGLDRELVTEEEVRLGRFGGGPGCGGFCAGFIRVWCQRQAYGGGRFLNWC